MAKFCVLCGQEVKLMDRVTLSVYDTKQTVCSSCNLTFTNAPQGERDQMLEQILVSPHLAEAETIHARLAKAAGKPCPSCGGPMDLKLENFSIGADGYGGLSSLGLASYDVDLYACTKCGRVVLYTAGFGTEEELASTTTTCPSCGRQKERSETVSMPRDDSRKKKDSKPPWER